VEEQGYNRASILVVEDETLVRMMAAEILLDAG
jgi:CheY-like chemotaxis protein